jgi:uncharacterized SAM-binding protein YcdF (DUF218 family)
MSISYVLYKLLGAAVTPPGFFCFLLLAIFASLLSRRGNRGIAAFGILVVSCLALLSTPAVSDLLLTPLESVERTIPGKTASSAVLVLAGGIRIAPDSPVPQMEPETLVRFLEGLLLARKHGWPLIYSGGYPERTKADGIRNMVLSTAERLGGGVDITVEGASRTTWENLGSVAPEIRKGGFTDVVLVTSAYHIPRALYCATRLLPGLRIHVWPALRKSEPGRPSATNWIPSPGGLYNTSVALREYIGLFAYRFFRH